MFNPKHGAGYAAVLLIGAIGAGIAGCNVKDGAQASITAPDPPPAEPAKPQPDRTGRPRIGVASFYAASFAGGKMANGAPMDPAADNAASRTLPIGTIAEVTDISTGKSAVVTIEDRGPYAKTRLVDLSPSTARKIGISPKKGIAKVRVSPILVPMPDGTLKPGVGASDPKVTAVR
jgi:rare lipoprotein A